MRTTWTIVVTLLLAGSAGDAVAQVAVERVRTRDGRVLDFEPDGAWRVKARAVERRRAALRRSGNLAALNAGGAAAAVTGSLIFPTILVGFQDTPTGSLPAPALYDALYYGLTPPPGRSYSLRTFYREMSNDSLDFQGTRFGWFLGDSAATWYLDACPGVDPLDCETGESRVHGLFLAALAAFDQVADLGQFDNDGPDGAPNSGDDDGSVDVVQFVQPVVGGECGGPGIWAHRWFLSAFGGQTAYQSSDPSANGGTIRASSYYLVSGVGGAGPGNRAGCGAPSEISGIGTAAHEMGHALGLPDLYDVTLATEGLGEWGLMGSGSYTSANSPAHFEAWSKERMGWVAVRELTGTGTYLLPPVVGADTVVLIRPPAYVSNPRGEYYLLENKQPAGSDTANLLVGGREGPKLGGLLVWHIDSARVASGLFSNGVNAGTIHGVALEQADGLNQLRTSGDNRGDAGDPYPGSTANRAYSPTSTPRAAKNADGFDVGFLIDSIEEGAPGEAVAFRVAFGLAPLVAVPTSPPDARMGAEFSYRSLASGGDGTYAWSLFAGALPPGLTLADSGLVSGVPSAVGVFNATLRVTSGGATSDMPLTIHVTAPQLVTATVLSGLLETGASLTADERRYLDLLGNRNGALDVGDFLAFVRTTGGAVSAATMAELLRKAGNP